jgi:hypothetical protein
LTDLPSSPSYNVVKSSQLNQDPLGKYTSTADFLTVNSASVLFLRTGATRNVFPKMNSLSS